MRSRCSFVKKAASDPVPSHLPQSLIFGKEVRQVPNALRHVQSAEPAIDLSHAAYIACDNDVSPATGDVIQFARQHS